MPWPGLSLVAVGRKAAAAEAPVSSTGDFRRATF
jgi:hypothetical protein